MPPSQGLSQQEQTLKIGKGETWSSGSLEDKTSKSPLAAASSMAGREVAVREFARWAISHWEAIKSIFKPNDLHGSYGGDGSLKRASSARGSVRPNGYPSASLAVPGQDGGKRQSTASSIGVAGAGRRRSSMPRNSNRAFVEGLRDTESRDKHKSRTQSAATRRDSYRKMPYSEWERELRKLGFQNDAATQIVFQEIKSEGLLAETHIAPGLTVHRSEVRDEIGYAQLLAFEKRPAVVMCTVSELMKLRRGTALRAWRIDADMQGVGRIVRGHWLRMCKNMGFQEQGKYIWDSYKPGLKGIDKTLSFKDFDPDEFANLLNFAEVLLQRASFDHEKAWKVLAPGDETDVLSFEEFQRAVKGGLDFRGNVRPIFDGLDASGQGRLWRDEFEYIWLITLASLKKRGSTQGLQCQLVDDLEDDEGETIPWEPSEFEANARDFARWASQNWPALFELFAYEEKRRRPGVNADELERWLHMLGYVGDVGAVFIEISRERPARGDYDPSIITSAQFKSFRQRRDRIAVEEFNAHLVRRRGSVLRAWKLDIDGKSSGVIEQVDFFKACRRLGYGNDILCVWDHIRMSTSDVGPQPTVCLEDICTEEAYNLQGFAELLLEAAQWNPKQAWQLLDDNGDDVITLMEFRGRCEQLGFQGDRDLLFTGLASNAQGFLWHEDMDFLWTIALLHYRKRWNLPPIYAVSFTAQRCYDGPFVLLGKLGLDSRGLTHTGEHITMPKLVVGLQRLGYLGSAMRAAIELVWKVLTGHDANPHLSSKNLFLKDAPKAEGDKPDKPKWNDSHLMMDRDKLLRTTYSKAIVNTVYDGDIQQERRRRLCEWHQKNHGWVGGS